MLSWSAETIEREHKTIGIYQKDAILCYIMALNFSYRSSREEIVQTMKFGEFFYDFGLLLYTASRPPMSMAAFTVDEFRILSGNDGLYTDQQDEVTISVILGIALEFFNSALEGGLRRGLWHVYYMLGKCYDKLRANPSKIALHYVQAVKIAPTKNASGNQEYLIEPHYKLCAFVLKQIRKGQISIIDAHMALKESFYYPLESGLYPLTSEINLIQRIKVALKHMQSNDKSHWQHRVIYRTAEMEHTDFKNDAVAKRELEAVVSKNARNIITIWRTELERYPLLVKVSDSNSYVLDLGVTLHVATNTFSRTLKFFKIFRMLKSYLNWRLEFERVPIICFQ